MEKTKERTDNLIEKEVFGLVEDIVERDLEKRFCRAMESLEKRNELFIHQSLTANEEKILDVVNELLVAQNEEKITETQFYRILKLFNNDLGLLKTFLLSKTLNLVDIGKGEDLKYKRITPVEKEIIELISEPNIFKIKWLKLIKNKLKLNKLEKSYKKSYALYYKIKTLKEFDNTAKTTD